MSFGGSNSGGTTTTQNQIPGWLSDAYLDNISRAEGTANAPFQGYGGTLTAGDNDYLAAARDQAAASGRVGQTERNQASKIFGEVADQSPTFTNAQQLAGSSLSPYMDPYENQVVQRTLQDVDLQRDRQANADNASTPSGAFGGSRQGVADSLRDENYDRLALDKVSQLRSAGFDRATGLGSDDVNRRTAADQFNSGLDMQNTALNLQGALGLLGTANDKQTGTFNTQSALDAAGRQLQGTQGADYEAKYNEFLRQQQDPYQKQTLVNSAVLGIQPGAVGSQSSTNNSKAKGYSL